MESTSLWQYTCVFDLPKTQIVVDCDPLKVARVLIDRTTEGRPILKQERAELNVPRLFATRKTTVQNLEEAKAVGCFYDIEIVSGHVKDAITRECGDIADYIPIDIATGEHDTTCVRMYAISWRNIYDILHECAYNEDESGRYVEDCIVDVTKIPDAPFMGLVKNFMAVRMVSHDVRKTMLRAGVHKAYFRPLIVVEDA